MGISSLQLEAFYALAQERGFTKAAAKLHVTQSALSQRILNLEEDLGTTLFIRDRSGVQLTEVAWELLRYCQTKETLEGEFLSRLKARSSDELRGIIRIAGFSSVLRSVILPSLTPLLEKHSDLQLEFLAREMSELPDLLKRGVVDFIVIDHKLDREELETVELGQELNVLVEKKGYKGAEIYLDHDEQDPTTQRYLKLAKKKTARLSRRYLDDVYGLLDGARLGIGRAVLPLHMIRGDAGLRVVQEDVILKIPVVLHYFQQPYYPLLHQKIVEALTAHAAPLLDARLNARLK